MNVVWLVSLVLFTGSLITEQQPCTDPVSFNSHLFTIRGPCPNDTVLLVPVGDTVQYRCDYEDRRSGTDLPYWHITELSGTPFLDGEGSEYNLTITSTTGVSGYTTLSIPVKEQYLNTTLDIKCGLCEVFVCTSEDRLNENIISTSVKQVTFSAPSNLTTSIITTEATVLLDWSSPVLSIDYTDSSAVEFVYHVTLVDMNMQSFETFYTTDSFMYLSRMNVTDKCIQYYWTVAATVGDSAQSESIKGNDSFLLQTEPQINTEDVSYYITNCSNAMMLGVQMQVSTFQPINSLSYTLWLNDSMEVTSFSEDNTTISYNTTDHRVYIQVPLIRWSDNTVTVTVSNECGEDTTDEYELNFDDIIQCPISIQESSFISTTSHQISSSSTSHTLTVSHSMNASNTIEPSVGANESNLMTIAVAGICVGVLIVFVIILASVLIVVYYIARHRKHRAATLTAGNGFENHSSKSDKLGSNGMYKQHVADYLTPHEINEAAREFKMAAALDNGIMAEPQYCEPQKLKRFSSSASGTGTHMSSTGNTFTREQNLLVEEMPGYSEPLQCIATPTRRVGTIKHTDTVIAPTYEDVKDAVTAYKSEINHTTDSQGVDCTYDDVNEIVYRKSKNNTQPESPPTGHTPSPQLTQLLSYTSNDTVSSSDYI